MNISTMLSALKVINEVMKLLNDIEVHTYIYYHIYMANLLWCLCWHSWISCIVAFSRLVICLCSIHTIDVTVDTSPVNEYSSIKLKYVKSMVLLPVTPDLSHYKWDMQDFMFEDLRLRMLLVCYLPV